MLTHFSRHFRKVEKIRKVKNRIRWTLIPPLTPPQTNTNSKIKVRLLPAPKLPPAPTTEVPFDFEKLKQSKKFTI